MLLKQFSSVILAFGFIFFGDLVSFAGPKTVYVGPIFPEETKEKNPALSKEAPSLPSFSFRLQVASLPTEAGARRETERLKAFSIKAKYTLREDASKKKWFIIYVDRFNSKEEATRYGLELIHKGIIKKFNIASPEETENRPIVVEKSSPPLSLPSKKEPTPLPAKSPVHFGPITIQEEETALRIDILLDRKILPEITADKVSSYSRFVVTFKNLDKHIVPMHFNKGQSNLLFSFSLARKKTDCTFTLLLSSAYNYQVAQDYYEKDKKYSIVFEGEPATPPDKAD